MEIAEPLCGNETEVILTGLPAAERRRLAVAEGKVLKGIQLCAMEGCAERFEETDAAAGFCCITWGLLLGVDERWMAITWAEDRQGDPFRISVQEGAQLLAMESAVRQDVSGLGPWSRFVGRRIESFDVFVYASNYAHPPMDSTWHDVPWGIRIDLGPEQLLVAAARHEHPFGGAPCADEIVVSFADSTTHRLVAAYDGARMKWNQS